MIPRGDVAAMREFARLVSKGAENVGYLAERLQASVQAIEYEGPAATRFRAAMKRRKHAADRVEEELRDLSHFLLREAGQLEDQIVKAPRRGEHERHLLDRKHQGRGR